MSGRDPYAGGYYDDGGGGYDDGSSDDGVDPGDVLDGGGSSGSDPRTAPDSSPGGSDPPPSDVGGPGDSSGSGGSSGGVDTGDVLDGGGSSGSDPRVGGGAEPETVSGSTSIAASATPGPRAPVQPGGGETYPIADEIAAADANAEIVERATTGGFLSERGGSAGVLPAEVFGIDTSETRAREGARAAAQFGDQMDLGAVFSSPADPLGSGGQVREGRPIGSGDPEDENAFEEFIEGGAQAGTNLPAGFLQAETAAEVGQSSPDIVTSYEVGEIAETSAAVGRDTAAETAAQASSNPAEFAGGVTAGAALGAGALSRGSTGGIGTAIRTELDPRIGPFGTTIETRGVRGVRSFLDDDRGQAQLAGRSRPRDPEGSGGGDADAVSDSDLGPDIGPFDRSDRRLYDPAREFDEDLGGMADPEIDAPSAANPSRDDIGAGVSGRGDPQMAPGVDADSFSERGFGDLTGTELDPNPTSTLGSSGRTPSGATLGRLDAAGAGVGGLLGTREAATATAPELDVDVRGDPQNGVDLDTGFTPGVGTDTPSDSGTDTPTDTGVDNPVDTRTDQDPTMVDVRADVDAIKRVDSPLRDPGADLDPEGTDPTRRDPVDVGRDRPRDPDVPFDPDRDPFEEEAAPEVVGLGEDIVTNPTRSLDAVDDELTQDLGGQDGP